MAPRGRNVWQRFYTLAAPFFASEARWKAFALLGALLGLIVLLNVINVQNSYVNRDFMTAVQDRDQARYGPLAVLYFGVFAALTVCDVLYAWSEAKLGLVWRQWLTKRLLARYLARRAYYWINRVQEIDNPDQRIAEDVRSFTATTLGFFLMLLNAAITAGAFLGVLWSISPWLFLVAVGYALFGSLGTVYLGRRLVGLNNLQLKKEADFRYELVRLREHAESVALLCAEPEEARRLRRRLDAAVDNFDVMIRVNRNLGFFTVGFKYMIQLLPLLLATPLYLSGARADFGVVTQSAMAFAQVVGALSVIIDQF
jgi:putative ATP-binding cassette transporter